jgi:ubiquinone/menaquinone biosynthesis C-methylase UbiE
MNQHEIERKFLWALPLPEKEPDRRVIRYLFPKKDSIDRRVQKTIYKDGAIEYRDQIKKDLQKGDREEIKKEIISEQEFQSAITHGDVSLIERNEYDVSNEDKRIDKITIVYYPKHNFSRYEVEFSDPTYAKEYIPPNNLIEITGPLLRDGSLSRMTQDKINQEISKLKTLHTYNIFGEVYNSEVDEFWENFPRATIDSFTNNLKGKRILNLGSGPGRDAIILKNKGLEVYCVDASPTMVNMTKQLGFESEVKDFIELAFPEESFDGVWAYTSLLHIPKSELVIMLKKIYKWLKKEGVFLIGMVEGTFEGMKQRDSMPGSQRYFRYYLEEELDTLIVPLGFKKIFTERYLRHKNTYIHLLYRK